MECAGRATALWIHHTLSPFGENSWTGKERSTLCRHLSGRHCLPVRDRTRHCATPFVTLQRFLKNPCYITAMNKTKNCSRQNPSTIFPIFFGGHKASLGDTKRHEATIRDTFPTEPKIVLNSMLYDSRERTALYGLRWQSAAATPLWLLELGAPMPTSAAPPESTSLALLLGSLDLPWTLDIGPWSFPSPRAYTAPEIPLYENLPEIPH
jgi:hypothetical protein